MLKPERQRLEKQHDILQSEWNIRTEKLRQLRQALAIGADMANKFQLERQVQAEEAEISRLGKQLSQIEQELGGCEDIEQQVQVMRTAIAPYIQERCGTMRVLDMSQPVGLGQIYTQMNILETIIPPTPS